MLRRRRRPQKYRDERSDSGRALGMLAGSRSCATRLPFLELRRAYEISFAYQSHLRERCTMPARKIVLHQ